MVNVVTAIAQAHLTSSAAPAAFSARWADTATRPDWNADTEWLRLGGPFARGATGGPKPKGGPKVPFEVTVLVPGREFTDVSRLLGTRLTFRHLVAQDAAGAPRVDVEVTLTGPLSFFWDLVLGRGIKAGLRADPDRLAAAAAEHWTGVGA